MNISAYSQAACYGMYQKTNVNTSPFAKKQNRSMSGLFGNTTPATNNLFPQMANAGQTTPDRHKSEEMRSLLRDLKQEQTQDIYAGIPQQKVNGFLELSGSPDNEKEEQVSKPVNYNYKEVANKIQRAKTSLSAGEAVLSAKRKLLEVRRKIAANDGDAEELQLALTHAKRMEMTARKKKHHLELEEMIASVQKRDENKEQLEKSGAGIESAIIEAAKEDVSKQEDAVFQQREELLDAVTEKLEDSGEEASDEMMAAMNEMIAEFGEEALKELEEEMELLENLEVVDPHMSKEELADLKLKHRNAENKAIVKAEMDYLKGLFQHTAEKGGSVPGFSGGFSSTTFPSFSVTVGTSPAMYSSQTAFMSASMPSIDISV